MINVKKKKALTILVSWLESTRTPHQIKLGDPQVDILIGDTPVSIDEETALGLIGTPDTALPVFWKITESAGVGKPEPKFRAQFTGSLLPHEDNELVAMRHTEFRKVPNNPEVFLRQDYQKIVSWAVSRFYRFNRTQLSQLGYEIEDLRTYAWMYVMNFHGLWRDVHAHDKKNGSALCNYLQQRFFTDFQKLIKRNAQNFLVDIETAELALDFTVALQRNDNAGGGNSASYPVAVSAPKPTDDLEQEFQELPVAIQMEKLVNFMKTRRAVDVKLEAEDKLLKMGIKNLSIPAKKQIKKFHMERLPAMDEAELAIHSESCSKCKLV